VRWRIPPSGPAVSSEVTELDWTVEQALKAIISGGMLMPGALPFCNLQLVQKAEKKAI